MDFQYDDFGLLLIEDVSKLLNFLFRTLGARKVKSENAWKHRCSGLEFSGSDTRLPWYEYEAEGLITGVQSKGLSIERNFR